jgi:hypothetical protein
VSKIVLPENCIEDLHDQRLSRLLDHWNKLRGAAAMPPTPAIDPVDFPYVLGYVTLVDVENEPRRYRFRLDGSIPVRLSGIDYTGRYLDALGMPDYIDFITAGYDLVVDGGQPYAYRKAADFDTNVFDEETMILPLGADGAVNHLMVAVIPGAPLAPSRDKVVL